MYSLFKPRLCRGPGSEASAAGGNAPRRLAADTLVTLRTEPAHNLRKHRNRWWRLGIRFKNAILMIYISILQGIQTPITEPQYRARIAVLVF